MSGFGRLFFTALGSVALFIGLSEPTNKTSVDQTLKEITDQRPDAFMQGIISVSLIDMVDSRQLSAQQVCWILGIELTRNLSIPNSGSNGSPRPGSSRANAVNLHLIEMKYSSPKTSSQIVSKMEKIPGTLAEKR